MSPQALEAIMIQLKIIWWKEQEPSMAKDAHLKKARARLKELKEHLES